MRLDPSLLWTWNRTIDRAPYLATGLVLMAVKLAIDWTVARLVFDQPWSITRYLFWPDFAELRLLEMPEAERVFALTMVAISLPFIWTGVLLTLHRLRAARLPLLLVVLFFVPVVNLFLFLLLSLAPTRGEREEAAIPSEFTGQALGRQAAVPWGLLAIVLSVAGTVGLVYLGATLFGAYGLGLFVGAPFFLGLSSVLIYGISTPRSFGQCVLVAMIAVTIAGLTVLVVAIEGAVCLLMAAPLAYVLTLVGAVVGHAIQARPWLGQHGHKFCLGVLPLAPAIMAVEFAHEPVPALRAVRTVVIVDAPPTVAWRHVIAFPPLEEPTDWLFRLGVAYPQRAEIHGTGVGAVRHCVFSTGTFVEPIEVWREPELLRFRVTDQPEPMEEWSPYAIHPHHLDHYLVSRMGQFHLAAMPGGRTRLEGTTWYVNRMWPEAYWGAWSDFIIHRIHGRVLEHVRVLAEEDALTAK